MFTSQVEPRGYRSMQEFFCCFGVGGGVGGGGGVVDVGAVGGGVGGGIGCAVGIGGCSVCVAVVGDDGGGGGGDARLFVRFVSGFPHPIGH